MCPARTRRNMDVMTFDVNTNANTNDTKRLRRSSTDKMVAGVCGGLAEYFGMDAALLRIALVAVTLFGVGAPILIYAACWILMPRDDAAIT